MRAESIELRAESAAWPADAVTAAGSVVAVQFHGAASRWQVALDAGAVWGALISNSQLAIVGGGLMNAGFVALKMRSTPPANGNGGAPQS